MRGRGGILCTGNFIILYRTMDRDSLLHENVFLLWLELHCQKQHFVLMLGRKWYQPTSNSMKTLVISVVLKGAISLKQSAYFYVDIDLITTKVRTYERKICRLTFTFIATYECFVRSWPKFYTKHGSLICPSAKPSVRT